MIKKEKSPSCLFTRWHPFKNMYGIWATDNSFKEESFLNRNTVEVEEIREMSPTRHFEGSPAFSTSQFRSTES